MLRILKRPASASSPIRKIGSEGVSGMQSAAFDCFMEDLCESQGVSLRQRFEEQLLPVRRRLQRL